MSEWRRRYKRVWLRPSDETGRVGEEMRINLAVTCGENEMAGRRDSSDYMWSILGWEPQSEWAFVTDDDLVAEQAERMRQNAEVSMAWRQARVAAVPDLTGPMAGRNWRGD